MLTVFLSGRGAIFLNWLRSGDKFNSNYFCQHVLEPLPQILHSGRNTPHRSAAAGRFFERCRFRHALQPPSSPDISPCDFFLFGDLKAKLGREEFEMLEQLQEGVEELLGRITPGLMERAYRDGIDRLDQVIRTNGDYI
jgi:hypothetical protein